MKNNSLKKTITAGVLCAALIIPAFAFDGAKPAGQSAANGSYGIKAGQAVQAAGPEEPDVEAMKRAAEVYMPAGAEFTAPEGKEQADTPWINRWYQWDGKDGLTQVMEEYPISEYDLTEEGIIKPEIAEKLIKETADRVIHAIKDRNAEMLSEYIHPVRGVRFTPYTNVSVEKDMVFDKKGIMDFFRDRKVYLWGQYDGSGENISLSPAEYYDKFIYPADYANAKEIGYNKVLSSGNMLENQFEVYKDAIVVEYYFPGFNPDYAGIDWKSLRLVFGQYGDSWKLMGIIHNQWTI